MPLVLPYQNAENAFRVISDFVTIEETDRNCAYFTDFWWMCKVAKSYSEVPPMFWMKMNFQFR
jgi:hypothetical protein